MMILLVVSPVGIGIWIYSGLQLYALNENSGIVFFVAAAVTFISLGKKMLIV
jgi:hypothetical protein